MKNQKVTRRSALKSLFIVSVLPSVFISSCTTNLSSPENPQIQSSKLFKSSLDSEIGVLENFVVTSNENGFAEIPSKYLHGGKSEKSNKLVLTRVGEGDFVLIFRKVEVISKDGGSSLINANILSKGTILIANPKLSIRKLEKIDKKELKRKFILGKKIKRGGK